MEENEEFIYSIICFFNHLTNFIEGLKTKTIRLEELPEENEDSDE